MIALHASLLARRTGRPVRMIYDRHEDLSATTKRHPAIVRHRTGAHPRRADRRPGHRARPRRRCVHDPHAGRPVAGDDPCRRPVRRRERPDPVSGGRDEHAAQRRVPRVRGATGGVRRRDAAQPRRRGARHVAARAPAAERLPAGGITPTGQVLAATSPARRSSSGRPRRPSSSGCVPGRPPPGARGHDPGSPARGARPGARGIGLALAWHGAGFTGSGEVKMGSVVALELTAEGRIRHPDRLDRDGAGDEDDPPAARRRRPRRPIDEVEMAPQDTAIVPDSGPTVASRTAMVVGGLVDPGRAAARGGGRGLHRPAVRGDVPGRRAGPRRAPDRRALRALSGRRLRRRHLPGDAYPAFGWAACVARGGGGPRHRRGAPSASRRGLDDVGRVIHPVLCRGPGRGRHAPGGGLRDDRGDQAARRPLPQRPARDVHHPDLARRAAYHDDPRRGAVRRGPARRQGRRRAADGRRGAGRRRGDRTMRPGPGSPTSRRARSGSWPRWPMSRRPRPCRPALRNRAAR